MIDRDLPGRPDVSECDLAIDSLLGRYIERRCLRETPCVHDLLAAAAEFGDGVAHELRDLIAFYETMRAAESEGTPAGVGSTLSENVCVADGVVSGLR